MAMYEDLHMYYADSWVGYKRDGKVLPFFIHETRYCGDGDEYDSDLFTDYEKALDTTSFQGYIVTNEHGDQESLNVVGSDPNLVLEPQDLGYAKNDRGEWVWNTVTIWYTVKKGLISPRLHNRNMNNYSSMYRMFNIVPDGQELLHRDVLLKGDVFEYKGAVIGHKEGNVITIESEYALFIPWFSGLLPSCQFQKKQQ